MNNDKAYGVESPAPLQHTTGLYKTWNYESDDLKSAWYTADSNNPTSLAGYIADSISEDAVKDTNENMVRFLQYKIGYVENNKTYGMCASVLNKCQNYTYSDGEFQNDNQVVREYLQRTLTQIKVAQDEIISSYAENCISDVSSCLNSNQYDETNPTSSKSNLAINACKAQIVTCMSVNGDASASPTPSMLITWVAAAQGDGVNTLNVGLRDWGVNNGTIGSVKCLTDKPTVVSISASAIELAHEKMVEAGELSNSPKNYPGKWQVVYGKAPNASGQYADYCNDDCCTNYDINSSEPQECRSSLTTNKLIITPEVCKSGNPILLKQ